MKGYRNYIIKSEFEFSQSFKTETGLELHADSRFSSDRLSNRIATIEEVPVCEKNQTIKKGFQVMIDPTIFYRQNYIVGGITETSFMLDRMKGLYTIDPKMIVLYRENENEEWQAFGENLMVQMKKETIPAVMIGEIILSDEKTVISKTLAEVTYSNDLMISENVDKGDTIFIKKGIGVSFWIDGKEFQWINNRHILAKIEKNGN